MPTTNDVAAAAVVSAYKWEDESNGEIYTDVPLTASASEVTTRDVPLYVVENGLEFPLAPIKQRRSQFEMVVPPRELRQCSPNVRRHHMGTQPDVTSRVVDVDSPTDTGASYSDLVAAAEALPAEPVVKSETAPYIMQEQEVLKNINIVGMFKSKFSSDL